MTAQSLLLHTIIAQVLYDTVRLRKVSRFSCNSWWFGGYLKASWRSMLDFSGREPWMPPRSQNDEDVQLLHGKGIKRHLVMSSTDFKSRDLYSVLMWELLGANRCENLVIFLRISVAIDLHEETTFIAHGIFTNSITQPFRFVLYYIYSRFMGSSCVKITYFVGHSRHFYHAVRLMVRWATIAKKLKN